MGNLKDKLAADDPDALDDLENAAEESKKAKAAAKRRAKRAETKYGLRLESEGDDE